jgi:mono/diheme cytochrome c family protein
MKFRIALVSVAAMAAAIGAGVSFADRADLPATISAPAKADNFRLVDNTGLAQDLRRLVDVKAIVVMAQVNGDKGSRKAAKSLEALKAKNPDVAFLMVNSSLADTREQIAAEAASQGYTIPVLDDDLQFAGEQLGFQVAGEVRMLEPKTLRVLYAGPVDKSGARKRAKGYLAEALAAVEANKAPMVASVSAKGAVIAFPERARRDQHAALSYARDIAPILEARCVVCHQDGGIGPFAMTNYDVVRGFAPMIREAVRTDTMPPWHPDSAVGAFHNNPDLTKDEARKLVHWIEAGALRGDGEDPLAKVAHVAPDWPLGKPDLVLDIPEFKLPASGAVDYQYPISLNPLKESRWVRASAYLPGERRGVHHILGGYLSNPAGSGQEAMGRWEASYGDFAVGGDAFILPPDIGIELPAGGGVNYQMHYTPFGKEATDRSRLGLYFYPEGQTPKYAMRHGRIIDAFIEIPPGEELHPEIAYTSFDKDALLYAFFLHTHYRGRAAKVELITPDGARKTLINLPRYDFNWQRTYSFAEPVLAPAGSRVAVTYWYDNSVRNPVNPDPTVKVRNGEQSWQEMHYTSFYYRWKDETTDKPFPRSAPNPAVMLMGQLDSNLNGGVERSELGGLLEPVLGPRFSDLDRNASGNLDGREIMSAAPLIMGVIRSLVPSRSGFGELPSPGSAP